jgi:hypothetical protein
LLSNIQFDAKLFYLPLSRHQTCQSYFFLSLLVIMAGNVTTL